MEPDILRMSFSLTFCRCCKLGVERWRPVSMRDVMITMASPNHGSVAVPPIDEVHRDIIESNTDGFLF
jgi:hypothetical protein